MSITSTLSIASQALKAQQLAIQTIGHNLANAATPGFSRQRVDLVTAFPSFEGGVFLGQGVDVAGVQRVVDRFTEAELLSLNSSVGYADAQSQALASIQDAFPTSGGIDAALSAFFSALSDVANNPAGTAERVSLVGKANALGNALAETRQILGSEQQNLDQNLNDAAQQVNTLVAQIAALNRQISTTEIRGESANDFRDQRQTMLQKLTNLTDATVREDANGEVAVTAGGLLLVGGNRFASLQTGAVGAGGLHSLTYVTPGGESFDATALFKEGEIGSLLSLRDAQLPSMIDRLDQLAKTLVDEINTQHALGFDLTGTAGGDFFAPIATTAGAAANVKVDSAIVADPRRIAAAAAADTVPGDNRNAQALVSLQSATFTALGNLTLQDSFLSLVGDIGSQVQDAQNQSAFQQALLTQTQARRESVSGVNIDEEMTKLIQFQRAFEASSLLVRTADDMYQSLIDMVR
jgi:flagellar hook-associated protein 1 FlgK